MEQQNLSYNGRQRYHMHAYCMYNINIVDNYCHLRHHAISLVNSCKIYRAEHTALGHAQISRCFSSVQESQKGAMLDGVLRLQSDSIKHG